MPDDPKRPIHEDRDAFRQALEYTAAERSFNPRIIEKDYYCSLVLQDFGPLFTAGLVFKGGTALSKVHAGFYRLSEDLDFVISIESDASRTQRRAALEPVRQHLVELTERAIFLRETEALKGASLNRHYTAVLAYNSSLSEQEETIRIEVGLREPIIETTEQLGAKTMLLDPFTRKPALTPVPVTVMSLREAYAEKIRAALSRRDPAIRDIYDLHHASTTGILKLNEPELLELVRVKLAVPDNDPPDVSSSRLDALRRQLETQLHPVLRSGDATTFDLNAAFELLHAITANLGRAVE